MNTSEPKSHLSMVNGGPIYLILMKANRNAMVHKLLKPLPLFANCSNGLDFPPVSTRSADSSHTRSALK